MFAKLKSKFKTPNAYSWKRQIVGPLKLSICQQQRQQCFHYMEQIYYCNTI